MDQRAVAGKGSDPRHFVLILLLAWLLAGCAGPSSSSQRLDSINGQWITVQRGDTLGAIAARADVPLERLTRFNPGVEPQRLAVGQRLLIPTQQERAPSGGPYRYQVRPGDTYSGIARRFGTNPARVQAANSNTPANRLQVGQVIQVPLSGGSGSGSSTASASNSGTTASSGSASSAPAQRPDPGNLPSSARNWPWPLDDYRVVRRFGPDDRGTLQPMLLANQNGSDAKAVADGQVRFAGSMRQLGRVVIVHHDGNLQSVYALCGELKVADGQSITQGTPVCQVDYSNSTERYDLLFDLRHGGKPVDPAKVLR
ncbi:LysM domain-containing protein [Franzmannia pantelleriensis]|uniref:LysM domain-containing protein n=1 Tax=Franzmannia pantelleriensis TaxID=48727 RepID=A0A1G9F8S0_9GAMM|nr:LysM peptidoglycan-binding domain-containing protein [Halomonas pantelleriensis]SDK84750.1 LysM domain-containing protein [Halomonas pantelleriensis]